MNKIILVILLVFLTISTVGCHYYSESFCRENLERPECRYSLERQGKIEPVNGLNELPQEVGGE